jgi:hypothetical protein
MVQERIGKKNLVAWLCHYGHTNNCSIEMGWNWNDQEEAKFFQ